ncbi:MAG: glycerol acyltransferase [Chloroflexaceae bacterium]|nr:glycerol acyltransferase [Chloroflexaceae bacterium]
MDLTWLNIADLRSAFGITAATPLRGLADVLFHVPARNFALQVLALDALVGREGLRAGGAWICGQLSRGVEIWGAPPPATGPALIVANHPGLLDAAALFASIPREDLRVLAITRPFLRALPHIAGRLFTVGDTPAARMAAARRAARHLRAGGALLTFPAGRIEPDPASLPGAEDAVASWSQGVDQIVQLAGAVTVVPAIVAGVLTPAAVKHPLTRLRRHADDRRWLAAILQLMLPWLQHTTVQVRFGRPIAATGAPVSAAVAAEARRLIREVAR